MHKYLLLFISFTVISQSFSDKQLSKYSLDELNKLYFESNSKEKKLISKVFLKKAIAQNDKEKIAIGYLYLSETAENDSQEVRFLVAMIKYSKKNIEDSFFTSLSYYRMGYFFLTKRKYKLALDNYIIANKYIQKQDDENLYDAIQFDIALINSSLLKYNEALPAFLESKKYAEQTNNLERLSTSIFAIAESYNRLGNLKLAKEYTEQGKKISLDMKDHKKYDKFLLCEGMNLYQEKKYAKAIELLEPTLNSIKYDFANYSVGSYYIGKCFLAINKKNKAIEYFKKVDSVFIKENAIYIENIDAYNHLINFYKGGNNIEKQLFYTNNLIKADKTLLTYYDYLTKRIHKDYDIPNLIVSKESLTKTIVKERYYFLFLMTLILLLFFVVFYKYRKKQIDLIKNQQRAFDDYKKNQINKKEKSNSVSNENLIIQNDLVNSILLKLEAFEKEKKFLDKDCSLDSLAKDIETNTSYLSKVINEKKGCNFSNYINGLRIDYCIFLLESDEQFKKYNMKGIADILGFNNANSFSRAFIQRTNMKPSFFINELKNTSNL